EQSVQYSSRFSAKRKDRRLHHDRFRRDRRECGICRDFQRQRERRRRSRARRLLRASVSDWRRYAYANTYGIADSFGDGYRHCDNNAYSDSNSYTYCNSHSHVYSDIDTYCNSYSETHAYAQIRANAEAPSHTSADTIEIFVQHL